MSIQPDEISALGGYVSIQFRTGVTAMVHPDRAVAWLNSDSMSLAAKERLRMVIAEAKAQ